ncbi:MAG: hypothetical protein AAGF87_12310 [Bacteroidota bacterium]
MDHTLQLDHVVNKIRQELGVSIIEKDRKVIFSQLENQHEHLIEDHKLKIDLNNWLKRKKIFGKKFPANPDFLLEKKIIGFIIFGFVMFLFLVFYLVYYVWK